jgi:hypothetical protein
MSRSIDKRRPRELTTEQKTSVAQDPELKRLIRQRAKMRRSFGGPVKRYKGTPMYNKYQESQRRVTNTRQRLLHALRKKVRDNFDHDQAVIDIKRQLSGCAVDQVAKDALAAEDDMLPQQIHLLEKLMTWPMSQSLEDEARRRSEAVDAVRAYCNVEEGGSRRGRKPKQQDQQVAREAGGEMVEEEDEDVQSQSQGRLSFTLDHLRHARRPLVCFLCFGNTKAPVHKRTKRYNRPQDLTRHFRDDHLKALGDGERTECEICQVPLENKMHLQSHGHKVHRTHS